MGTMLLYIYTILNYETQIWATFLWKPHQSTGMTNTLILLKDMA